MSESLGISQPPDKIRRPHVVIIGGGFAGIAAAKALRHCEADVTVIDRRNHHIFQPLLYQVATAVLAPADVAAPIRQLSAQQKNVSVLLAEVIGVDLGSRSVDVKYPGAGEKKITFDYLVVAAGVQSSYFGHNELAKYASCLKTITDVGGWIARELGGDKPPRPFRYFDKGNMAVIGKNFAILESGRIKLAGIIPWFIWAFALVGCAVAICRPRRIPQGKNSY